MNKSTSDTTSTFDTKIETPTNRLSSHTIHWVDEPRSGSSIRHNVDIVTPNFFSSSTTEESSKGRRREDKSCSSRI